MQDHSTAPAAQVTIYALCEPGDPQAVRYVGQTRQDLKRRYVGHLNEVKHNDTAKTRWVRGLLDAGAKPLIRALAVTDEAGANMMEGDYIRRFREQGCAILNDGKRRGYGARRLGAPKKEWQAVTLLLPPALVAELKQIGGGERGAVSRAVQRIVNDALTANAQAPALIVAAPEAQDSSLSIRLPASVRAEVEALAHKEYRTMCGQVLMLIMEALAVQAARAAPVPAAPALTQEEQP